MDRNDLIYLFIEETAKRFAQDLEQIVNRLGGSLAAEREDIINEILLDLNTWSYVHLEKLCIVIDGRLEIDWEVTRRHVLRFTYNQVRWRLYIHYRRPPSGHLEEAAGSDALDPSRQLSAEDQRQLLFAAIASLKPIYQIPICLFFFGNFSGQEIADAMGCSPGTVRKRIFKGKAMLKAYLESMSTGCDMLEP